jgi:isovaleryl-CoA dehydrogenase
MQHQAENAATLAVLQDSVYDFVRAEIQPLARQIDQENRFPPDLWKQLGAMGLLGITAPEAYGGSNLGYKAHAMVMQAISYASASVGLSYAAHSNLCLNQLVLHGNDEQQARYLPSLISGDMIGALAISEVQAGSDAINMQLQATPVEGGYTLQGNKMWITNGPDAALIIVYAKTDKAAKAKGITAFIVDGNSPGLTKMPKLDKLGMRGSNTCELVFNQVFVPESQILGSVNAGIKVMMDGLDIERLILAAGPVGIMEAAIEHSSHYIRERKQFGSPIGSFQLIQAKIADMYTHYQASHAYLMAMADACDAGTIERKQAASVILFAAEKATQCALDAIQIFGGNGYTNEYDVSRLLRDAKLYEIGAGTSEIRRIIVGRDIFEAR